MTMTDRPRLGGLFTGGPAADRAADLAGLLGPATQPGSTEAAPAPSSDTELTGHDQPRPAQHGGRATRTARQPAAPAARDLPAPETGNKVVPVVLDASVLAELRVFAGRTEQTHASVALRAIEANADALATYWKVGQPAIASGRLFGPATAVHRRTEPGVQTQLRMPTADAITLDDLVTEWAAPSRSALVNEALRRYIFTRHEASTAG
jgi:hypothetical protein